MADEFDTNEGLTRREALKKGAMLGGALVWAIPVVQTVGMSAASAREPSEGECCLRIVSFTASWYANTGTVEDDVRLNQVLKNCGSLVLTNVAYSIDRSLDGGATWPSVALHTGSPGTLNPGESTALLARFEGGKVAGPTYLWRITGTFTCQGVNYTQQTIPATQYKLSNPLSL